MSCLSLQSEFIGVPNSANSISHSNYYAQRQHLRLFIIHVPSYCYFPFCIRAFLFDFVMVEFQFIIAHILYHNAIYNTSCWEDMFAFWNDWIYIHFREYVWCLTHRTGSLVESWKAGNSSCKDFSDAPEDFFFLLFSCTFNNHVIYASSSYMSILIFSISINFHY